MLWTYPSKIQQSTHGLGLSLALYIRNTKYLQEITALKYRLYTTGLHISFFSNQVSTCSVWLQQGDCNFELVICTNFIGIHVVPFLLYVYRTIQNIDNLFWISKAFCYSICLKSFWGFNNLNTPKFQLSFVTFSLLAMDKKRK